MQRPGPFPVIPMAKRQPHGPGAAWQVLGPGCFWALPAPSLAMGFPGTVCDPSGPYEDTRAPALDLWLLQALDLMELVGDAALCPS